MADRYRLEGLPMHVLIHRAGVMRSVGIAPLTAAQMDAELATIRAVDHHLREP